MGRIYLRGERRRRFDFTDATKFEEGTCFDGQDAISKATGSSWGREALYHLREGLWVLHCWSQRQGSRESFFTIPPKGAAAWLAKNGEDPEAAGQGEGSYGP